VIREAGIINAVEHVIEGLALNPNGDGAVLALTLKADIPIDEISSLTGDTQLADDGL
jgi:hypothetical protein